MGKIYEEVWDKCLDIIKDNVGNQSFKTWFEPIKAVNLKGDTLTIQVPSPFFYEYLEEQYIDCEHCDGPSGILRGAS